MEDKVDAKELRTGNLLQGHPISITRLEMYGDGITAITAHGIDCIERGLKTDLKPIPISEKILKRLGFELYRDYSEGNGFTSYIMPNGFYISKANKTDEICEKDCWYVGDYHKIETIHWLQNYAYFNHRIELTLKS